MSADELHRIALDALFEALNTQMHSDDAQMVVDEIYWDLKTAVAAGVRNAENREKDEAEEAG